MNAHVFWISCAIIYPFMFGSYIYGYIMGKKSERREYNKARHD